MFQFFHPNKNGSNCIGPEQSIDPFDTSSNYTKTTLEKTQLYQNTSEQNAEKT